ncbi:MAG: hypothetical protein AAGA56_19260 [Myxococcota bacterium]
MMRRSAPLLFLAACSSSPGTEKAAPSASASGSVSVGTATSAPPMPSGVPRPDIKPYDGPTGKVAGQVTIVGDPPPDTPFVYPTPCREAAQVYGKLFRKGADGALADALVSVTEYKGYVPPKEDFVDVTFSDCAYSARTIALTDGQQIRVRNRQYDTTAVIPHLDGARLPSVTVAVPQGDPVILPTRGRSRYWLRDQLKKPWLVAHVFHLPYATTDVTNTDGAFEIDRIPVGEVTVSVLLPQTMLALSKRVTVKDGETSKLDFELSFDAAANTPADGHGGTRNPERTSTKTPPRPPTSASSPPPAASASAKK